MDFSKCDCNTSYIEYLNTLSINELQEMLSLKNNTLYELKCVFNTLNRENIDSNYEENKLLEIKEDIHCIISVLNQKKGHMNVSP